MADCIHAVSGVDVDPGLFRTRTAQGDIASYFVLQHLPRWIICWEPHTEWLERALGLDQCSIVHRRFGEVPRALLPILGPYYDTSSRSGSTSNGTETGVEGAGQPGVESP